jgi:lipoyl-dependent peroxiredoxin
MKFSRKGSAGWKGTGKEGVGTVSTQTKVLDKVKYGYKSRFEDGPGTNPEELIGAAHASCFTMKLSFVLNEAGFTADNIDTVATVTFEDGKITSSHLDLSAKVPGITEEEFQKAASNAKENCPVSLLLNAEITLAATLVA